MKRIFLITLVVLFIFGCNESQITDVKSSTDPSKQESFEKTKQLFDGRVGGKVSQANYGSVILGIDPSIQAWSSYIKAAVNEINAVGCGIIISVPTYPDRYPDIMVFSDNSTSKVLPDSLKNLPIWQPGGATPPQNGYVGDNVSINMECNIFRINNVLCDKLVKGVIIHELLHCFGFMQNSNKIFDIEIKWIVGTSIGDNNSIMQNTPRMPASSCDAYTFPSTLSYLDKKALYIYYPKYYKSIPLHRFWNPNTGFNCHYYTNTYELYNVIKNTYKHEGDTYSEIITEYDYRLKDGWIYECTEGFISEYQRTDTKPLYRYYYSDGKTKSYHLTTTNLPYIVLNYKPYKKLNLVGYVYTKEIPGKTVPLYEYYNSTTRDYFYTTNYDELGSESAGYQYKRKAAHIWPMPYKYGLTLEQRSR